MHINEWMSLAPTRNLSYSKGEGRRTTQQNSASHEQNRNAPGEMGGRFCYSKLCNAHIMRTAESWNNTGSDKLPVLVLKLVTTLSQNPDWLFQQQITRVFLNFTSCTERIHYNAHGVWESRRWSLSRLMQWASHRCSQSLFTSPGGRIVTPFNLHSTQLLLGNFSEMGFCFVLHCF